MVGHRELQLLIGCSYGSSDPAAQGRTLDAGTYRFRLEGNEQSLRLAEGSRPSDINFQGPANIKGVPRTFQSMCRARAKIRENQLLRSVEEGIDFGEEGRV